MFVENMKMIIAVHSLMPRENQFKKGTNSNMDLFILYNNSKIGTTISQS